MFDIDKAINNVKEYAELLDKYRTLEEENKKLKEDIAWYEKEEDRLREENRLLKNEIAWLKDHTKYNYLNNELYVDGTMTATEAKLRLQQAEDIQKYISRLEKEIKKLNEKVKKLEKENERLKEKLLFYKGRWKQNKFGGWYFEVKKPKDTQN